MRESLENHGIHEALVSEEVWEQAQIKAVAQAKKYEKVNSPKGEKIHLLSGILRFYESFYFCCIEGWRIFRINIC